jgi:predicted transcriptional regulator
MSNIVTSLSLGVVIMVCHILLSTLLVRILRQTAPVILHFLSMLASLLLFFVVAAYIPAIVSVWHGVILISVGAVFWVFGFSAVYKSISLKMLAFLYKEGRRSTTIIELQDKFGDNIFETRIKVLLDMEMIIENAQGRYEITPKGVQILKRFGFIRFLFGVRNIGFYG